MDINKNPFETIDVFQSFDINPNSSEYSEYKLKDIEQEIVESLRKTIQKLENSQHVYLCARGDSRNLDNFENFVEKELSHFFIVGEKARSQINTSVSTFRATEDSFNSKDIPELITLCNKILEKKGFNKIDKKEFMKLSSENEISQKHWKLLLLSLLHTKGRDNFGFKDTSPFLSLSYGGKKYKTAEHFATGYSTKGLLYVYILGKSQKKNYFKCSEMIKELKHLGIKWDKDTYKEIMLLSGMFPHTLIGFFEANRGELIKFILNPWFYKKFKEEPTHDFKCGVIIDQKRFQESARRLDYKKYSYRYQGNGRLFESNLDRQDNDPYLRYLR